MIAHDDVTNEGRVYGCQVIEPFVNGVIGIGEVNKRLPAKAGEGDEVDSSVLILLLQANRHNLKVVQAG